MRSHAIRSNENAVTGDKVTRWGVWTIRDCGDHKVFGFPSIGGSRCF